MASSQESDEDLLLRAHDLVISRPPYWDVLRYWFEAADRYGVRVAVASIMAPLRAPSDRATVARSLLHVLISLAEAMTRGIANISSDRTISKQLFRHAQTRRTETQAERILILSTRPPNLFANIVPAVCLRGGTLSARLVLQAWCNIDALIAFRINQPTPETVGMAAYELACMFTEIGMFVDKTIVYVWDNILAEEDLWDHLNVDGQRGFMEEIDFENCIIPPKSRCRKRKGANAIARETIDEMWGVGWKVEFDPGERLLGGVSEGFLTQLAAMAKQGWGIHGVRGVLDIDDDEVEEW